MRSRSIKLRVFDIVDVKGELTLVYCVLILRLITLARKFSPISGTGMKLPRGEKESIKYTLPRDAAFRLPTILKFRPL